MSKLVLGDIVDVRAYERERAQVLERIISLKKRRRVPVGPILTLVFENRETVRFQIQEMARAERMLTDEAIQGELDTYNVLIPEGGQLSATLFVELTSEPDLREWLPRLVGVERSVTLQIGAPPGEVEVVRAEPEATHAAHLTRDDLTASVHYIRWSLTPSQVDRFGADPVSIAVDHKAYQHVTPLAPTTKAELLADLLGDH